MTTEVQTIREVVPKRERARLTIIEQICFQDQNCGTPMNFGSPHQVLIESDEEPFCRNMTVTDEWTTLERGHIVAASMVLITNSAGAGRRVVNDDATIQVRMKAEGGADFEILPRDSARIPNPTDLNKIQVRSSQGPCKVSVQLFPK